MVRRCGLSEFRELEALGSPLETKLPAEGMLSMLIGLRILAPGNLRRGTSRWSASRRAQRDRSAVSTAWVMHRWPKGSRPATVILSRLGPRQLDGDNLQAGFKAVRDQVAAECGIDDGDPGVTWIYEQETSKPWGCRITVWWAP